MSTIQQLKNFIRHGKQARVVVEEPPAHKDAPQNLNAEKATVMDAATGAAAVPTANAQAQAPAHSQAIPPRQAKSAASDPGQVTFSDFDAAPSAPIPITKNNKNRRVPDDDIAKIVAEERETRSKFPRYPGLERWELLEKMGDGAFSNVYRARDRDGEYANEVAIKVVRKYEMTQQQGDNHLHPNFKPKVPKAAERANILKEVTIMRKLDHPNIVRLIDFAEAKQYYYIVLELAPGGELFHQIVKLTYFSEDLSRHVIVQVAKALEYLHETQGVVHRDIKPENILFYPIPVVPSKHPLPRQAGDEDKVDEGEFVAGRGAGGIGQIKIADFGLSKVIWENNTQTPCGTVGYTAPEIVKDERYSKAVDMWALGCVLYTLLCGFPPFYDESIEVLTEKVAKGEFTFLSPWWDDISKSAQDLISHLLDVDPERRYTIVEFLNHPWIRASGPTPRDEKKEEAAVAAAAVAAAKPFDVNKFADGERRGDFRSPGAVNLREVFDVGYAVHRQEEEDKRRKNLGARTPGIVRMGELTEEADEESQGSSSSTANASQSSSNQPANYATYSSSMAAVHGGAGTTQDLENSMRNTSLKDNDATTTTTTTTSTTATPIRGRQGKPTGAAAAAAAGTTTTAAATGAERGYGQHSATVAAAARQQVRDHNRQKGAFELNLDGATLLGRRGAKPAARVA